MSEIDLCAAEEGTIAPASLPYLVNTGDLLFGLTPMDLARLAATAKGVVAPPES